MPRGPRTDSPGALHHVYNRGAARRPVFENVADLRSFQAQVACVVRAGLLEVHAFALLTTHYHLLVGSPAGALGEAMRRIGNGYVRRFNRERRRDGALMRGRYGSRPIDSAAYFGAVVRYIDRNPVDAGLCGAPHLYPHCSAWHFARSRRPPWLTPDRVEALVCDASSAELFRPDLYTTFASAPSEAARDLVEARLAAPPAANDALDDLVRAAPLDVQRWMVQRASLADGTTPGTVLLSPASILGVLGDRLIPDPPYRHLAAGLLRGLSGRTLREIAARLRCCQTSATLAARAHAEALRTDPAYAALAASIVHAVIRLDFGPPPRLFDLPRRLPTVGVFVEDASRGFVEKSARAGASSVASPPAGRVS